MKVEALPLDGVFRLVPEPEWDSRGFFARCYERNSMAAAGLVTDLPEWSLSYNTRRGTLRGLHWQAEPYLEAKMVQCIRGAVFDVAVDMRKDSPNFRRWHGIELSAENRHLLYIPKGFAHGFQTLTDHAELLYHVSEPYRPDCARGVRWNDPDLAIDWPPIDVRIVSERDSNLPLMSELTRVL